jgi:hypothetical protein
MAGVLLLTTVLSFLLVLPSATAIGKACGNAGNYTANSTYQSNLASLVAALPSNTSSSPQLFATATAGQPGAADAVYALALCRGDMTNNLTGCSDCVAGSFRYAQRMCPNDRAASAYDDACFVGFSNDRNLLVPTNNSVTQDASTLFDYYNPDGSLTGNATAVSAGVRYLLEQTAQLAANNSNDTAPARFATALMDASTSITQTLYSTAQCTPDLSAADCLSCLRWLIGKVNDTSSVRNGGRILVLRCNLRFESNMFYDGPTMKRIPEASSGPPAPPGPAPTTTDKSM